MAMSSLTYRRCLAGAWNPGGGHHESDSPPNTYAYALRQSSGHHDHLPGRGLTDPSKEAADQTLPVAAFQETSTNQSNNVHPMSPILDDRVIFDDEELSYPLVLDQLDAV